MNFETPETQAAHFAGMPLHAFSRMVAREESYAETAEAAEEAFQADPERFVTEADFDPEAEDQAEVDWLNEMSDAEFERFREDSWGRGM